MWFVGNAKFLSVPDVIKIIKLVQLVNLGSRFITKCAFHVSLIALNARVICNALVAKMVMVEKDFILVNYASNNNA